MRSYQLAKRLRIKAERESDPGKYKAAGKAFKALGMKFAAARCQERAAYYEIMQSDRHLIQR
jgi:hypothetical protein